MDERVVPTSAEAEPSLNSDAQEAHHGKRWGLVSGGLIAAGILGFVLLQVLAPDPGQVPRVVSAPLVQVQAIEMTRGPIPVKGNGPVRPRAEVLLVAQVSGEIVETSPALVTGGSFKQGDTLARIDPRPYRAALDQVAADRLARQADLDFAGKQLARDQQLTQSGAASERRRDETLNQRDRARAQIAGLDALISARAIDLERTAITAPFDGRVLTEQIDMGSVVQPGTEIGRVYASDIFEIVVPFSDREAALIPGLWDTQRRQAPRAKATLPFRGRLYSWDGYVDRVEAGIDPDTRTIDVVIRVPNPTQAGRLGEDHAQDTLAEAPPMLIGTYAAVEIEGMTLSYALIPRVALRNSDTIWLVDNNQSIQVVKIDLVQDQGAMVAVRSPEILDGAQLIVSDLAIATAGLKVSISEKGGARQ